MIKNLGVTLFIVFLLELPSFSLEETVLKLNNVSIIPFSYLKGYVDFPVGPCIFEDVCLGVAGLFTHVTRKITFRGGASFGDDGNWAAFIGITFSFGGRKL